MVTAGGDHYVTAPITNTGIIEVDAGDLHLNGGGTSTGQINVGPGAAITFGSDFTASTLNDSGTVLISGGTFTLNGALTEGGPVSVQIGAGATFDASGGSFATAESFNFTGTSGTLELNSAELSTAANATQVTGFNSGDVLKITDAATRATWSDNVLTLFNGDTAIGSVNLVGDYANANFLVTSTGSGNSQITLSGLAVDGYIAGATVFADAQGTGVYAAGDASSTTNALGQFSLPGGSGPLILTGGVDEGTNLKFTGVLSAPSGSSVITPLTTLVTVMAGANPSAGALAAAEAAVQQAFGLTLPPGSSLTDFDPEAGTAVETPGAILVFAAGAQVQDTLALLAAGLIQAGASAASANAAALHALANAISGAPSSLDLSDPATVKALVTAATSALTGLNPFSTTDLATLISASNATIVSDTTAFSGSEAIREISAGERVAQGDTASAVTTSGASQTVLDAYTGANLDSAVNAALADVICFMPGTRIRTPDGDREVESLQIGDLVTSSDGLDLPVRWIGRQTVSTRFADPLRVLPIRICEGAFGVNQPERDLLVSPDHALFIGGVLVQAGALVNGSTITREQDVPEVFTYFHIELADHSLILAEGVPAETFIDNVDRMGFDNWQEHEALCGGCEPLVEMPYPRAKSRRQLPRKIREQIEARLEILAERPSALVA